MSVDEPQTEDVTRPAAKNVVGPQVKRFRASKDWTQEELAAHCNLLGWDISRSTLAKIESQVRRVTDEEVALLAKVLKVGVEKLYR